jgi:hypothetical protein
MENHGKYNELIFTHADETLYVNLFIASELNWKEKGVKIRQETQFPLEEQTKLSITKGSSDFILRVRHPEWVKAGSFKITINGTETIYSERPSSYVSIRRKWEQGDEVLVELPMQNTFERMPNVPEYIAFMHGPILLGAKTGAEDLKGLISDDGRWGQYATGTYLPTDKAPIIIEDNLEQIADKLEPVEGQPLNYALNVSMINPMQLTLEPFYQIHDARYMMYWLALTSEGYKYYLDSLENIEKERSAIEKRTIDFVATGEQQPETDHAMQSERSHPGSNSDVFFREAHDGGFFSYDMKTNFQTDIGLLVRYWGGEYGGRKFEIFIDDVILEKEDHTGRWNQSLFKDVEYKIPDSMVVGKSHIRVKFQALPENNAVAVYDIKLLKPEDKY